MAREPSQDLLDPFRSQDTHELIELLKRTVEANEDDDRLKAIKQVLERRQARFPDTTKAPTAVAKRKNMRPLGTESNAMVYDLGPDKLELCFPKHGFLRCEKSAFRTHEELVLYLAEAFSLSDQRNAFRLGMKRTGKYQRIDHTGRPIFTFGNPILDMITDEHGWISIGNETYHLLPLELAAPQNRKGGITSIDLALNHEEILRQQLAEALSGNGTRTVIECNSDRIILATANPSQLDFYQPGTSAHMKFRSWKTNAYSYKSIGTEIETWGGDFSSASIRSTYASPVVPNDPFVCGIDKVDSDSDTNDDYVDEYEYTVGFPEAPDPPNTVRSYCVARWKGQLYSGTVSKGDCQLFL
jgi:hypothetical protein